MAVTWTGEVETFWRAQRLQHCNMENNTTTDIRASTGVIVTMLLPLQHIDTFIWFSVFQLCFRKIKPALWSIQTALLQCEWKHLEVKCAGNDGGTSKNITSIRGLVSLYTESDWSTGLHIVISCNIICCWITLGDSLPVEQQTHTRLLSLKHNKGHTVYLS